MADENVNKKYQQAKTDMADILNAIRDVVNTMDGEKENLAKEPEFAKKAKLASLDLHSTMQEVSKGESVYKKDAYRQDISDQIYNFVEALEKERGNLPVKLAEAIETQKEYLEHTTSATFYKIRTTASLYIGMVDKEAGDKFRDSISLPKLKAREGSKENTKVFSTKRLSNEIEMN